MNQRSASLGEEAVPRGTGIGALLCERLCQNVGIDRRPDGALMLRTPFRFPDGDGFPSFPEKAP